MTLCLKLFLGYRPSVDSDEALDTHDSSLLHAGLTDILGAFTSPLRVPHSRPGPLT